MRRAMLLGLFAMLLLLTHAYAEVNYIAIVPDYPPIPIKDYPIHAFFIFMMIIPLVISLLVRDPFAGLLAGLVMIFYALYLLNNPYQIITSVGVDANTGSVVYTYTGPPTPFDIISPIFWFGLGFYIIGLSASRIAL